ncbi:MAG: molecular chaperone [Enterobacter hormaechei]|nr:molecular chaperone [Enterobacter hormaechei]
MRVNTWICLAGTLCSSAVYAGGVGLGATRLIYTGAATQTMMQVRNTHPDATFLIQSWMEDEKGSRTNWMTVKAIPQQVKNGSGNSLQFASANRIKVFYRPERLREGAGEAWKNLAGAYRAGKVTLTNPTPYYLTTINVKIDGRPVSPVMVPPKSSVTLADTFSHASSLSYQPARHCPNNKNSKA